MRVLLAAAFALSAVPALAQEAPAKSQDDAIKCVHVSPPIGSRGGWHDECHTLAEWKALEGHYDRANRDFSDMNSRSGLNNGALGH